MLAGKMDHNKQKTLREQCITFSIRRKFETNNILWIDVGIHIHGPDYIVCRVLNIIHSTVKLLTSWMKLSRSRMYMLHPSHYYTAKCHVPNAIFVNITIFSTEKSQYSTSIRIVMMKLIY